MDSSIIRNLGKGLHLRRSTPADAEKLVAFHADVHREARAEEPDEYVAEWVRDLMSGEHPSFRAGDFTVVEDARTGAIVSSLCLLSQTWTYRGIAFGIGRPELVGTHPDYRNRGLVRAQFEVIHDWSARTGHLAQAITGIPYFYRQFGYEMALTLGGSRAGYGPQVPKLKEGEKEAYGFRAATEADLPFLARVHKQGSERHVVSCLRDEALWRYTLLGQRKKNVNRWDLVIIEAADGRPVGFLGHAPRLRHDRLWMGVYELGPGVSWLAVTPAVVRYLWATGEKWAAQDPAQQMSAFAFALGAEHPAYDVLGDRLPHTRTPYAWYIRVPDLPAFLRHIAPTLEQRLSDSPLAGHTGEVKISFYRQGLRLTWEGGRLKGVEPWQPTSAQEGDAGFPDLTFLQLLFGYRSLEDLRYAFPDCWAKAETRALLVTLFPRQASDIWPVS
jgi:hypothetical protein